MNFAEKHGDIIIRDYDKVLKDDKNNQKYIAEEEKKNVLKPQELDPDREFYRMKKQTDKN